MQSSTTKASVVSAAHVSWHQIDWAHAHRTVRKLQVRIAKATRSQEWRKVNNLQRLLVRSFCSKALAVKRVAENNGKWTPGVDHEIWDTPEAKALAIQSLGRRGYKPQPLRRIRIPKDNGKERLLGIPTMKDRAMQALYLLALEPVSETLADHNSYGFRPHRTAADAIEQCYTTLGKKHSAQWVLEADIKSCFDNISHEWLIANIPMDKEILRKWLKAGVVDSGNLYPTDAGTPQGGIISPVLANMTLDGLEGALERFGKKRSRLAFQNKVHLVRYADDLIITGNSEELLRDEVMPLLEEFLAERGLGLSLHKTKITHINEGFDFLGQNVRKFRNKLIIQPSAKNVSNFMQKVRTVIKGNKTARQVNLIRQLNPIIKGWSLYHSSVCAKNTYNAVDHEIGFLIWQWAKRRHPNKGARWVKNRYFAPTQTKEWVFADNTDEVDFEGKRIRLTLSRTAQTRITRHRKIKGDANPYDPEWDSYFEQRISARMVKSLKGRRKLRSLWNSQSGKCLICQQTISVDTGWEVHHLTRRNDGGSHKLANLAMLHPNCHKQVHSQLLAVRKPAPVTGG